jgi:hypothetical protein
VQPEADWLRLARAFSCLARTDAAAAGVEERVIAQQTGHRSMLVLRRYVRAGEPFRQNAAAAVGLQAAITRGALLEVVDKPP